MLLPGGGLLAEERRSEQLVCAGLQPGVTHTVTRIIDGETLALDDGRELRLIGALAPRAIDVGAAPGTWPLEIAAAAELRALVLGKSIELAFGGERIDRHARLQAHAFWMEGQRRRWVQGHLLEQGLARAYVQAGNRACAGELLEAEETARRERRGLWAEAAYEVRPADPPQALLRQRGTYQVVLGRIARVGQSRWLIYLNFGFGRQALSATLRRVDGEALLGAPPSDPKQLEGKLLRVRGWIERRHAGGVSRAGGPVIDLSAAGMVEVVDEPAATSGGAPRPRSERTTPRVAPKAKPPDLIETGR